MTIFLLSHLLEHHGIDVATTRLVRHDLRGVAAYRDGGLVSLGCFASFQTEARSPYSNARTAIHLLPGPVLPDGDITGWMVGGTEILDQFPWTGDRLPAIRDAAQIEAEPPARGIEAFDLAWIEALSTYRERILVRWGAPNAGRAWSQWAGHNPKDIVELRREASEPPFPGFADLSVSTATVPYLPAAWQSALTSVRGVYLLVAADGSQYVGSAAGEDGFLGRWLTYARDGHGGNIMLRAAGHDDYRASVLEIASPADALRDILAREAFWKRKLGTRAHGLNAN